MKKVFIDGSAGTTGLRIYERLLEREDIELLEISEGERKNLEARLKRIEESDITFLCLPDDAAKEIAEVASDKTSTVIIDTSTAHRTAPGWVYGFPEIGGRREEISQGKRIANPGCHASGCIALLAPLIETGLLSPAGDYAFTSLTGYSGGGKAMIEEYETGSNTLLDAPRAYGLGQKHKHLPEIKKVCNLEKLPMLIPIVAPYYSGMEVILPLQGDQIKNKGSQGTIEVIKECYGEYYPEGNEERIVRFVEGEKEEAEDRGFLSASGLSGKDDMRISVHGNEDRVMVIARFDNLGKGASGAAIQNMNLVLGVPETRGLII